MNTRETSDARKLPMPFSSRLKREREQRGWTQSKLAERLGTTQITVSRWENSITVPTLYYRQKLAELFAKSIQELGFILDNDDEHTEETPPLTDTSDANTLPSTSSLWNVPYRRNPFFTGREAILDHLYTVLKSNKAAALTQPQAISGLGGIGKTQIAVEYAYRNRDHYTAVFWINASTHNAISADFVAIAALLGLPVQQEQDIVVRAVKNWLTDHTGWLLILDNVDNLEMVAGFLPVHGTRDVLLTTRLQALGPIARGIEVEKMGMDEGMMLLLRRAKIIAPDEMLEQAPVESREQAAFILSELDGLPLALDQAAAYIEETHCGLAQYLNLYGSRRKDLLLRRGQSPLDHPESVTATWSLSLQQIKQESPAAAELLYLLAFLNPEAIPEEIITLGAAKLGPSLSAVASDPLELDAIIELLLRYSLIRRTPEEKLLSIHRLVQAVLKDGMDKNAQNLEAERAIRAINHAFPTVELHTWGQCQRCLPHVLVCVTYVEEYDLFFPEAARLFNEAASYLIALAQYEGAEVLLRNALTIRQRVLEVDNPSIAHTLNDLGALYRVRGGYLQAEQFYVKALQLQKQAKGSEHPDVAQTLNNMGSLYRAQGAYAKAELAYKEALRIREKTLGIEHLLVAQSYYSLAKLYHSQGKYRQAVELCEQALRIQEQQLGDNHPTIASTLSMLAKIYQEQLKLVQAEETNMRALRIRERTSGPQHPHVAVILNNIIEIYHAEGRMQEAEPMIARALKIHEQSLGREHPYIAYSISNLAEHFFLQGDYVQAETQFREALAIREQRLGRNHPRTASTYDSLARLYTAQKRYEEAESLYSKVLTIYERTLGPEHPFVANTLEQYANVLHELKKNSG
jgi:tetratricopeptide (TPR) repeat protein/DNA-binding XRE family transcriptional regulator